jgi:hypothetical protein
MIIKIMLIIEIKLYYIRVNNKIHNNTRNYHNTYALLDKIHHDLLQSNIFFVTIKYQIFNKIKVLFEYH